MPVSKKAPSNPLPFVEFGRAICGDLTAAERREWLVTNGLGGFASGTIAGTLTRRYHGLLVAAFRPPVERMLLATKIDEVVTYRGIAYSLAANRWQDGYVSPQGFTTIDRFYLDGTTPVWEFALADGLLEKRIWMEPSANNTYVRYRALRGGAPFELALRTFVNYRSFHGNTHAGDWHIGVTAQGARALRIDAVPDGRAFWIAADAGTLAIENVWYRDFVLSQETLRGLDDRDDHLSAGSFVVTLETNGAITIAASETAASQSRIGRVARVYTGHRRRSVAETVRAGGRSIRRRPSRRRRCGGAVGDCRLPLVRRLGPRHDDRVARPRANHRTARRCQEDSHHVFHLRQRWNVAELFSRRRPGGAV
jgi:glycogen debranching enzyme